MSQTLITSLRQRDLDVEHLAQNFALEFATRPPEMYVQLANIICYCCKIPSFPPRMIKTSDLIASDAFLRRLFEPATLKATQHSTINDLHSSRQWPNVLKFFHYLIHFEWELLSGATKFDSFFAKFISMLTNSELPVLRYFGAAIQLEFISVTASHRTELLQNECKTTIFQYTNNILLNSFHDYDRKIWMHCLLKMRQWFQLSPLMLEDKILRFLVWGLRDRSTANVYLSLQIASEVLNERKQNASLILFVKFLLRSLTPALATKDTNFFTKICDCACVLYHNYQPLSNHFLDTLFRFTFAVERAKAKAAASVFLRTKLQDLSSTFECVRLIVQFLAGQNSVFVELFTDAMIDDCQLLTDWDIMGDALLQLTDIAERETLLLLILCVASLVVDNVKPFTRDEKTEIHVMGDVTAAMTAAFAPLLDTLSNENSTFRWKLLVAKLATYLNFDRVHRNRMEDVFKECLNMFLGSDNVIYDITQANIMLRLIAIILQHCRDDQFRRLDFSDMLTLFEKEFVSLARQMHQYTPEKYVTSMNIVIGTYSFRSVGTLNEKCLLDVPVQILQEEPQADDNGSSTLLSLFHEVAIIFCSEYVVELLYKSANCASTCETAPDSATIERVKLVLNIFGDYMNKFYHSRLGELVFFAQCRLAKAIFASNCTDSQRNSIFTEFCSESLCAYVALTVGCVQPTLLSSVFELGNYSVEKIIAHFSDLILSDILPLNCAYELLHAYCCQSCKLQKELRNFLVSVVERKSANEVAQWLFGYFAGLFEIYNEDLLKEFIVRAKRLSLLLKSIKSSVVNVVKYFHKMGIDFAVRPVMTARTSDAKPTGKFLLILVEFSPCLNAKTKEPCYEYFQRKQIVGSFADEARLYGNSLKVKKIQILVHADGESVSSSESKEANESDSGADRSVGDFEDSSLSLDGRSVRSQQSIIVDNSGSEKRLRLGEQSSED